MLNTSTILDSWRDVFETGYTVRKNKYDGLNSWQPLKTKYSTSDKTFQLSNKIVELVNDYFCVEQDIKEYTDCYVNVPNSDSIKNGQDFPHFFVQHFRIPFMTITPDITTKQDIPLVKLMQIAYNAGQFRAASEEANTYNQQTMQFYNEHKLDELDTYI